MDATSGMMRVTFGKSRVRESRKPGSVRAKAEWLSYSTVTFSTAGYQTMASSMVRGTDLPDNMV